MDHTDYTRLKAQLSAYRQMAMKRAADWINEKVDGVTVDNTLTDPGAYCLPLPREISVNRGVFSVRLTSNSNAGKTKTVNLPATLLDGIELSSQKEDLVDEQGTEFKARELTDKLRAAGFEVLVQQTGGGTATIYAKRGGITVLGGPGAFDWSDPDDSTFDSSDFYVGVEDNEEGGKGVDPGSSMVTIAALFITEAGAGAA